MKLPCGGDVLAENWRNNIVAFSDGADTYSQNHGVGSLGVIEAEEVSQEHGPACSRGDSAACAQLFEMLNSTFDQLPQGPPREQALTAALTTNRELLFIYQHACQAGRAPARDALTSREIPTTRPSLLAQPAPLPPGEEGGIGAQVRAGPDGVIIIELIPGGGVEGRRLRA